MAGNCTTLSSALQALKQQLDTSVVPVHPSGFAWLPEDALSSVQHQCEAVPTPSGVWTSAHQMQLPAALAHHICTSLFSRRQVYQMQFSSDAAAYAKSVLHLDFSAINAANQKLLDARPSAYIQPVQL